ncbi:UPF0755 protein [Parabacteroides sp. PFB2-10]|uniref:endolytic transglycosylase MltG n=1 Tax=Parabacteroides sp. PFB2-10 TaxID=1742405 RepID=UPI00247727F9|nr:endolytic transglycosylase MltG [Parabacteroides sp. PFB2-10]MDH6311516.1 UPF0755 protein [Parabacteroides sp. PFB2-10]MDL2244436.1 endolytic transglycosylase MltG [Parabacteroides sp. OttesenSCG-928-J18]
MGVTKRSKWVIALGILFSLLLVAAAAGYWLYQTAMRPNFNPSDRVYVYVDERKNFDDLCAQLTDSAACSNEGSFRWLANRLHYPETMRTGRYAVEPEMSNLDLLNRLRRGQQTATRITFNNIRFLEDLTRRLDEQLMLSSEDILNRLTDPAYCDSLGFDLETIRCLFIPNTYEVYWNISPDALLTRMKREYDAFWTDERRKKAESIGLTPTEVAVLASIVEEETAVADEFPVVAGLYINRLHRGMLLQADPTVKYAVGDFMLQRILYVHLEVDSPYNTYIYPGLPPGPLRIPSIQGLNAVLNYAKHNYLYMVAKEDFSGRHNFASTLREHNNNANRYRQELNRRNIR